MKCPEKQIYRDSKYISGCLGLGVKNVNHKQVQGILMG